MEHLDLLAAIKTNSLLNLQSILPTPTFLCDIMQPKTKNNHKDRIILGLDVFQSPSGSYCLVEKRLFLQYKCIYFSLFGFSELGKPLGGLCVQLSA